MFGNEKCKKSAQKEKCKNLFGKEKCKKTVWIKKCKKLIGKEKCKKDCSEKRSITAGGLQNAQPDVKRSS